MYTLVSLTHSHIEVEGSPEDFMDRVEQIVSDGGPLAFMKVHDTLTGKQTWINPIQICWARPTTH